MRESVYIDMTPGMSDVPDSTWAGATAVGVRTILMKGVTKEKQDQARNADLRGLLQLHEPMHVWIHEHGAFESGGSFELIRDISPSYALESFYSIKSDYLREAWLRGDTELAEAHKLFDELEKRLCLDELRDQQYPIPEGVVSKLLSKLGLKPNNRIQT